jgi:hypothetical protein
MGHGFDKVMQQAFGDWRQMADMPVVLLAKLWDSFYQ